eukprot:CAMPEP_0177598240 /NCGR_PEP_ID=MMETSP0419_2-20121207/12217_1 /TAXON_ID=582737 /ORGANISM="Tetraselmis sp., Strain GSL018" /LENGTH=559 /DNA_ID=CAMNT_0019090619 /DNA_START=209 /DNA_END=1890 /DNA_ORIENTATION=+
MAPGEGESGGRDCGRRRLKGAAERRRPPRVSEDRLLELVDRLHGSAGLAPVAGLLVLGAVADGVDEVVLGVGHADVRVVAAGVGPGVLDDGVPHVQQRGLGGVELLAVAVEEEDPAVGVVLHHREAAEAGDLHLARPPRRGRDHVEGAPRPEPREPEEILVAVDDAKAVQDVVRPRIEHEHVERRRVPPAVHQQLTRLLLKHVHKRGARQLPHEARLVQVEDRVAPPPKVRPEHGARLEERLRPEEVPRVAQREVVRVQEEHLVKLCVVDRVDLDVEALLLPVVAEGAPLQAHGLEDDRVVEDELPDYGRGPRELVREVPQLDGEPAAVVPEQPHRGVRCHHRLVTDADEDPLRRVPRRRGLCPPRAAARAIPQRLGGEAGKLRSLPAGDLPVHDGLVRVGGAVHGHDPPVLRPFAPREVARVQDLAVPRGPVGDLRVTREVVSGSRGPSGVQPPVCRQATHWMPKGSCEELEARGAEGAAWTGGASVSLGPTTPPPTTGAPAWLLSLEPPSRTVAAFPYFVSGWTWGRPALASPRRVSFSPQGMPSGELPGVAQVGCP